MSEFKAYKLENVPEYHNMIAPDGTVVSFYKSYTRSNNNQVQKWIEALPGSKEVDDKDIPTPPNRHVTTVATGVGNSSVVTAQDLLAVAAKRTTPVIDKK
ncbi:MAG: hypothetical protein ACK5LJ_04210 [Paracoccus sp. (in: a-proteobacteria)]